MKIFSLKFVNYDIKLPLNRVLSESFYDFLIYTFGNEMLYYY